MDATRSKKKIGIVTSPSEYLRRANGGRNISGAAVLNKFHHAYNSCSLAVQAFSFKLFLCGIQGYCYTNLKKVTDHHTLGSFLYGRADVELYQTLK